MNALRARLGIGREHHTATDVGFTLVEVVVAIFIFSIIAAGSMYSMLSILQLTRDSRSQQVAANLAAQEIDLARDYSNLFALESTTYTKDLNGDTFTITRVAKWVNSTGNDVQCNAGGTNLSYKRVNVKVEWENMRSTKSAVHSDTVIDPKSKITDPTKGTILVAVQNDGGTGTPGVVVTVTKSSVPQGAVTPTPNTAVTDSAGCAYILRVTPGNYDIALSHPSNKYVDELQNAGPTKNIGVVKNTTSSKGFLYAKAGTLRTLYGTNYSATLPIKAPTNLDTTFVSTYGVVTRKFTTANEFDLHPFGSGYQVIGGTPKTCPAHDPQNWKATKDYKAPADVPFANPPADPPSDAPVAMGVVKVDIPLLSTRKYIRAVSVNDANSGEGRPGCSSTPITYRFGAAFMLGGSTLIALPYGKWHIYADTSTTSTSTSRSDRIGTGGTKGAVLTYGSLKESDGEVILDPRASDDEDDD